MNETNIKWLVVVNPHAGGKKAEKDWPKIRKLLTRWGLTFEAVFTEYINHAPILVQNRIVEHDCTHIIAVGGDGTFNEVVNGIFSQRKYLSTEITLGLITVGTGNDWGRMYGLPEEYEDQIKVILTGKSFLQDVGKVYYKYDTNNNYRYFVNIAGMGYDALVVKKTNKMKEKGGGGGAISYVINLVTGLFQYSNVSLIIENETEKVFEGKIFSMSIGICKFNGGGMMQLPDAVPDDGLFDVTVISNTTKMRVIKNIKNLFDGSFVKMPEVYQYRGKKFTITSKPHSALFLETDGESLGHSPLVFEILNRAVKIRIP